MNTAAQTHDRRYYGVVPALVTDVEDEGGEARVKVTFPWFNNPDMESDWARVLYSYAGNGYGWVWVPEVGDEVLVSFVMGDMRLPIILGGVYNGVDKPPVVRDAQTDQKVMRTKAGHQITFDDKAGEQHIEIKTVAGNVLDLSDKDKKITLTTPGGVSLTLEDTGTVTVKGSTSISLDAPKVSLGTAAAHSLLFADIFLPIFNAHTHLCTAPGTPSAPPLPILPPTAASTVTTTA
jgi:phage baseplate assembly protein V